MKLRKWLAAMLVFCMSMLGIFYMKSDAAAADTALTDENPQRLEIVTQMDEEGNITEGEDGPRLVEESGITTFTEDDPVKVVNFRTKGNATTEYTEAGTGRNGYTNGAYGADAAYLGESDGKVKFMLSGVVGLVDASEVQVVNINDAAVVSCYSVINGKLMHNIVTDMTTPGYANRLANGDAPSFLNEGADYYSYDGHYFYTDYAVMLEDYRSGTRANAVNPNSPYYNYYQYLPLRSQSSYGKAALENILEQKISETSKMMGMGATFVESQNTYGVNALLMAGVAANESAWGMSSISQNKNNLFGLNAVDSSPGTSANQYGSVESCILDFSKNYMSRGYLYPKDWRYMGGFLGNKASGINVSYASDPYWGEKAANIAWTLDNLGGGKDSGKYVLGVKDTVSTEHNDIAVTQKADAASAVLYSTGEASSYSMILLASSESQDYYKIQSDAALSPDKTTITKEDGLYDFDTMYAYIPSRYVTAINGTVEPEQPDDQQPEITDGWKTEADGSRYYYRDGELVKGEFIKAETEGDYYFTDASTGAMVTSDWVSLQEADPYNNNTVGKVWYHIGTDGLMQRGWIKDETGWKIYYLDSNGRMCHSIWANASSQPALGMPAGMYNLCSDGAVQMNGWAESPEAGVWWFCNPDTGWFDRDNPASWSSVNPEA